MEFDGWTLLKHPILNYRINRAQKGLPVRGLTDADTNRCPLVLDDMAVMNGMHYPCIIHLREGGDPIGRADDMKIVRQERLAWFLNHNTHADPICAGQCLDVCVSFNNRWKEINETHLGKKGK